MPRVVRGHTQAPTYMIAERGAAMLQANRVSGEGYTLQEDGYQATHTIARTGAAGTAEL